MMLTRIEFKCGRSIAHELSVNFYFSAARCGIDGELGYYRRSLSNRILLPLSFPIFVICLRHFCDAALAKNVDTIMNGCFQGTFLVFTFLADLGSKKRQAQVRPFPLGQIWLISRRSSHAERAFVAIVEGMNCIAFPNVPAACAFDLIALVVMRRTVLLKDVYLQRIFGGILGGECEKTGTQKDCQ
jgi:hypothetical protein